MAVNKVQKGDGTVLIDLTLDTFRSADQLAKGIVGHTASGEIVTGTLEAGSGGEHNVYSIDNGDGTQTLVIDDEGSGGSSSGGTIDDTVVEFDSENSQVKAYLSQARAEYATTDKSTIIANYADGSRTYGSGLGYTLTGLSTGSIYLVDETTGRGWKDTVTSSSYNVANLIPNHIYRWFNTNASGVQKSGRIKDTAQWRMFNFDILLNARDIGGKACDGGTMKFGKMLRSARVVSTGGNDQVSAKDKDYLRNLFDVRFELDFRTAEDVADPNGTVSAIGTDVVYERIPLDGGYLNSWGDTDSEKENAKQIIETVMRNAVKGIPTLFHCSAGADRTGTLASILEGICGVSWVDMDIDFELSSFCPKDIGSIRERYATSGNGYNWYQWKKYINGLSGDNKWLKYLQLMGIDINLINAYRRAMIDGNPQTLAFDEADVTNMIPLSTELDGSPYNGGLGYKVGYYWKSGAELTEPEIALTGYIPISHGQTITFENIGSYYSETYYSNYGHCKITVFNANKTQISDHNMRSWCDYCTYNRSSGILKSITFDTDYYAGTEDIRNMAYVRISVKADEMTSNSAIYIS